MSNPSDSPPALPRDTIPQLLEQLLGSSAWDIKQHIAGRLNLSMPLAGGQRLWVTVETVRTADNQRVMPAMMRLGSNTKKPQATTPRKPSQHKVRAERKEIVV